MYCKQCGKEISPEVKFCTFCGTPTGDTTSQVQTPNTAEINEQITLEAQTPNTIETYAETKIEQKTDVNTQSKKGGSSKAKWIVIIILLLAIIGAGVTIYMVNAQKAAETKSWDTWVESYQQEVEEYYLSDEQREKLDSLLSKVDELESEEGREPLKNEMIELKGYIVDENKQYQDDIDARLNAISSNTDLTFAYEEELQEIDNLILDIKNLRDEKKYDAALEQIIKCEEVQKNITEIKSGWNISVVQRDVSEYPKVRLYLDIRDEGNNSVNNLDQKIFFLSKKDAESGEYIKKEITSALQLNENESLNINLVADVSGSMETDMSWVKDTMNNFINTVQFGAGDKIELTEFSDVSNVRYPFTNDVMGISTEINNMHAYGGTKLYDTLIESVMRVYGQSGAKCVIAFTDGLDNRSVSYPEDVIAAAKETGVPIFIIGIGNQVDEGILQNIATSTGGYYTNSSDLHTMNEIYNSIYRAQKEVYCLEYNSDEEDMMDRQEVSVYLRGEEAGATVNYEYIPSDDFFDMLLNNYLNSYIKALTEGNASIMDKLGYAAVDGSVYKDTSSYINSNKDKLSEQLLKAEVIDIQYVDENTYNIRSNEVYDIQWVRNFTKDIKEGKTDEAKGALSILTGRYPESYLENQDIKVYKARTLKGYYSVKKSPEGKWQIYDFMSSYDIVDTNVYNAHIDGEQ